MEAERRPAPGGVALLLIDVINPMDFAGAEALQGPALAAATSIRTLRDRADALGVPVVYVNDNGGHWGSERAAIVAACRRSTQAGHALAEQLAPRPGDYFVIKPRPIDHAQQHGCRNAPDRRAGPSRVAQGMKKAAGISAGGFGPVWLRGQDLNL